MASAPNLFPRSASFTEVDICNMILVPGLEEQVEELNNTFISLQALLSEAEKRQLKEEPVQLWLERLRDISYEIEDVLDVWKTVHLKLKIIETRKAQNQTGSYQPSYCSWLRDLAEKRDLQPKIAELKERLDVINQEREVYKFQSEKDAYRSNSEPVPAALPMPQRRKSTSFIKASNVCGRDLEIQRLVANLCNPSQRKDGFEVISVVGMGGVGKTTLAQCIHNDATVRSHFQKRIWVCVSDPFDEVQVAKSIAKSLGGNPYDFTDLQDILECVNSSIAEKRYLLVLDDVWTEDSSNWESLLNSLDSGADGSKILVTTRHAKCAKAIGSTRVHPLGQLSAGESWNLFSQIALFDKSEEDVENLKEIGQKIAEKCKGLPLALKAIASHLQFKSNTEREWQKVLDSEIWELETAEERIFNPLLLSYYDLTSPIKKCFSFCAVFPKDYEFEVEELKMMWMSQGYLNTLRNEDMEAVGEEYFEHLLTRSFFQDLEYKDSYTGVVRLCKMHDIVHDFAQFLSKEESLIIDMEIKRPDLSSSSCRKLRHLTVLNTTNVEGEVMSSRFSSSIQQRLHDLHTLRVSTGYFIGEIGKIFLNPSQHLCFIKALDLSYNGIVEAPEGIGQFVHLRYLDLSCNSKLKRLPGTIYELCNLQTLFLNYCESLRELPEGIEKLINLRHLGIYEKTVLPKGIGRLSSLRALNYFNVGRDIEGHGGEVAAAATIGDLRNLNNLQGCLSINNLINVKDGREARKAELWNKRGLFHLILTFNGEGEGCNGDDEKEVIIALEPCHSLEKLEISDYSGKLLPSWISLLTKLRTLHLYYCMECEELPPLGQLPSLESLYIRGMRGCKRIGEEFWGIRRGQTSTGGGRDGKKSMTSSAVAVAFPKLKELILGEMSAWTEWEDAVISGENDDYEDDLNSFKLFPCLEKLEIWSCWELKSLPQFISKSPIQTLMIWGCPILEERCQPETGEDWSTISHIPNIIVNNGGDDDTTVFEINDGQLVRGRPWY